MRPQKLRVLITAGPTREMIDPVRFLSNVSTGHMGYALSRAAMSRQLEVTLISGPTALKAPQGVKFISVLTAQDMKRAISNVWKRTDILIMTAAVCDYTPIQYAPKKIKRVRTKSIHFKRTEDLLHYFGKRKGKRFVVGFALETDHYLENASRKLKQKQMDLVVLNWFKKGHNPFGPHPTSMKMIGREGVLKNISKRSKKQAAGEILKVILGQLEGR